MLLLVVCLFVALNANAQAPRHQRSDTPIVPKKGVFGAGIKPPVINVAKPQACLDSLYLYNKKIKRDYDSVRLYHPEVHPLLEGETYFMRSSCIIPVDIDFFEVAKSKKTKNGDIVWSLSIQSEGADKLAIAVEQCIFSPNSEICVYSKTEGKPHFIKKIHNSKRIVVPTVMGSEMIIEYKEKKEYKNTEKNMHIHVLAYCVNLSTTHIENSRAFCTVDANCNPSLLKEHRAVGMIANETGGLGTGVLLNNTNNDKQLYLLTARHVALAITSLPLARVEFNYKTLYCDGPANDAEDDRYIYPIESVVASDAHSDFALLKLESTSDDNKLTYAGWYNGTDLPFVGAGLHHPLDTDTGEQEPLRISTFIGSQTNTFANTFEAPTGLIEPNKLWEVTYEQALIKDGSSGGPLFNESNKVVGQVIGDIGGQNCSSQIAAYGRFDAAWNGNTPQTRLKDWLDPNNTGDAYVSTLYPWDLQMKDSNWANCDDGTEPNYNCSHGTGNDLWYDIWESPDLWNCQGSNDCTEPQAIKSGQTNRLRFTIRNPNNCASDVPTVHLYWTAASTGEVWPEDWIHTGDNCRQGDEIATLALPTLAPNEVRTSSVNWTPPTLSSFSDCGSADINDLVGSKMEMCLLARLETPSDPILREEEDVPATINILYNNNIVTRNTVLEDIQYNQTGQASIIHLKNNNHFDTNLNLVIKGLVKVTPEQAQ